MITEHEIGSEWLTTPRKAVIYPVQSGNAKDCLIFLDGELYRDRVKSADILQAAQRVGSLPPVTCVNLPNTSGASRHVDYTCNESFASFVALDLPRWIERVMGHFDRLFLCGLSLSGLQAVLTALQHPGIFSGILSQSPSAWWNDEWLVSSVMPAAQNRSRFWMSVGTQELQENVSHPPTGLFQKANQLDSVRRLASVMVDAGHEVRLNEYDGGHDPACWATELPGALSWLLNR